MKPMVRKKVSNQSEKKTQLKSLDLEMETDSKPVLETMVLVVSVCEFGEFGNSVGRNL